MLGVDASINKQTGNNMKIIMIEIEDEDYETFSMGFNVPPAERFG